MRFRLRVAFCIALLWLIPNTKLLQVLSNYVIEPSGPSRPALPVQALSFFGQIFNNSGSASIAIGSGSATALGPVIIGADGDVWVDKPCTQITDFNKSDSKATEKGTLARILICGATNA